MQTWRLQGLSGTSEFGGQFLPFPAPPKSCPPQPPEKAQHCGPANSPPTSPVLPTQCGEFWIWISTVGKLLLSALDVLYSMFATLVWVDTLILLVPEGSGLSPWMSVLLHQCIHCTLLIEFSYSELFNLWVVRNHLEGFHWSHQNLPRSPLNSSDVFAQAKHSTTYEEISAIEAITEAWPYITLYLLYRLYLLSVDSAKKEQLHLNSGQNRKKTTQKPPAYVQTITFIRTLT